MQKNYNNVIYTRRTFGIKISFEGSDNAGVYVTKCRLGPVRRSISTRRLFHVSCVGQRPSFSVFRCMNRGNDFSLSECSRDTCTYVESESRMTFAGRIFGKNRVCGPLISLPGLSLFLRNHSTLFTDKVNRCASLSVEAEFWKLLVLRNISLYKGIICVEFNYYY